MVQGLTDIGAEGVLLAGAGRAILLQLANPAIGHGIVDHSDFAARPVNRLVGTLTYVYAVVYGSENQLAAVRRRVNRAHAPVRRAPTESAHGYNAFDAGSQLWVVATLYDTAVTVHERVYGPLDQDAADRVYSDYAKIGTALQLPAELWPRDRSAFRSYWEAELAALRVDESTRRVARALLHPMAGPLWLRMAMPLARFVTTGFLHQRLREDFGLRWSRRREQTFHWLMRATAVVYPRLPRRIRHGFRDYCLKQLEDNPGRSS